jgi:organic radical activating enzyme
MKDITIPNSYNYIAVFLTLSCNYSCSYCINYFEEGKFNKKHISGEDWVRGLNRIISRDDLPVTLQGGEPSIHKDFIYIINNLKPELKIDILTNLQFDVDEFISKVNPERLKRKAPYASIRVSYHPEAMDLQETIDKTLKMLDAGFYIGIWEVLHPGQEEAILRAKDKCQKLRIDFRTKEFLGEYNGKLYGTYKYPGACEKRFMKKVLCKTTELIIGSDGSIFRCHSDLYETRKPIGYVLDPEFQLKDGFRGCDMFGHCNPCDIKIKTNRFQQFGHTSVEIKFPNIK